MCPTLVIAWLSGHPLPRFARTFDRHRFMPLIPEEPQIHESVPGPRNAAGTARTQQASRTTSLPGPRSASDDGVQRAERTATASGKPAPSPSTAESPASTVPSARRSNSAPTAQIQLIEAKENTAVEAADEAVDALLDQGRAPGDVLVFTTGEQHPWAQHELSFGEDAYWRQLDESEDVFCAHASAVARASDRAIVVLAVNGGTDDEVAEALPAVLRKAKEQLTVCGDPQRLSSLL